MNDALATAVSAQEQQAVFHFSGRHSGPGAGLIDGLKLRPALFARFHDLTRLRYDFPLVLLEDGTEKDYVRSLSGLVDDLLQQVAPAGVSGERLRRNVLRLEREIRVLIRSGATGSLVDLWDQAAAQLVMRGGEGVQADLTRARAALLVDGLAVDCDPAMPPQLLAHAWRTVQRTKVQAMRAEIDALIVRLADLVRADHLRSGAGRSADTLAAGFGGRHRDLFDFDAMARLLAKPSGVRGLSEARCRRIESAIAVLSLQQFFVPGGGHGFEFGDAAEAVAAYRRRLPEVADLVKAMTVADLEVHGRYVEAKHDPLFEDWGPDSLRPLDLARFPDYLVCRGADREPFDGMGAHERALLLEALASGAPIKIVVDSGPLPEDSLAGDRGQSLGAEIAFTATGIDGVYVLQAAASHLYRVRGRLIDAMHHHGPALISVYSGAQRQQTARGGTPPYLLCAAAMESRVFPAFCCDPGAGADWAGRFTLDGNPQMEADWPKHDISWADANLQRTVASTGFTLADFAACDPSFAHHFAGVPGEDGSSELLEMSAWLAQPANGVPKNLPFVYAIDAENRLRKLVVDEKLVRATRRCAESWRRLRELDGLKRKGASLVQSPAADAQTVAPSASTTVAETAAPAAAAVATEQAGEVHPPGEPYIETERCSSCNECTNLNSTMFAYNENKQAYIKNPDAGTFRELVEAAESCQVAVIHPGKPRNPKEPGLEELVRRAEPFQ